MRCGAAGVEFGAGPAITHADLRRRLGPAVAAGRANAEREQRVITEPLGRLDAGADNVASAAELIASAAELIASGAEPLAGSGQPLASNDARHASAGRGLDRT